MLYFKYGNTSQYEGRIVMGLFRLLFGKRKKKDETVEPVFIGETTENTEIINEPGQEATEVICVPSTTAKSKPKSTEKKETRNTEQKQPTVIIEDTQKNEETVYNTEGADNLSKSKETKKVKVKGYGGAFEIKKSKDGRFVFNLYASNKVIIATSQIYSSSQSAITGINSVIANAEKASIEDQTLKTFTSQPFPKWEIYIDKAGQFRFRLLATNGSCICHSQGYTQKSTCKKGIESIIRTVKSAEIDKSYLNKQTKNATAQQSIP